MPGVCEEETPHRMLKSGDNHGQKCPYPTISRRWYLIAPNGGKMTPLLSRRSLVKLRLKAERLGMHARHPILAMCLFLPACSALGFCNTTQPLDKAAFERLYASPLPKPAGAMRVFHLGHSLVSRDMPAMLQQLAPYGHEYESQLGWGTTLKSHWEHGSGSEAKINGFEIENNHPRYRDAKSALHSGHYNAFIMTEMVSLRDAIRYYASWDYVQRWARLALEGNPNIRVYLYETWHGLDETEGWLERLDRDLGELWEGEILRRAAAAPGQQPTIYLIPAGQVFARLVRELDARGGVGGLNRREDLFGRMPDGTQDTIHPNDIGAYVVALTHYAVLYHRTPVGLPYELRRANGQPAVAPSAEAARRIQEIVWEVVKSLPRTGVPR
jgi:hypothetical protein